MKRHNRINQKKRESAQRPLQKAAPDDEQVRGATLLPVETSGLPPLARGAVRAGGRLTLVLSKTVHRLQRDVAHAQDQPSAARRSRIAQVHDHVCGQRQRDALGDRVRSQRPTGAPPSLARAAARRYPVPWTTGKTPRLGRTPSSTRTGPLLVAILCATVRLRFARCEIFRPSHAGCLPRVAASRTSRPSSGSNAAPGATPYSPSGRRSSRWPVSRFCVCSFSSGPPPFDQSDLLAGRGACCSGVTRCFVALTLVGDPSRPIAVLASIPVVCCGIGETRQVGGSKIGHNGRRGRGRAPGRRRRIERPQVPSSPANVTLDTSALSPTHPSGRTCGTGREHRQGVIAGAPSLTPSPTASTTPAGLCPSTADA